MAPEDMQYAVNKVKSTGNDKVCLTERGASFGYHNLVVDMRSSGPLTWAMNSAAIISRCANHEGTVIKRDRVTKLDIFKRFGQRRGQFPVGASTVIDVHHGGSFIFFVRPFVRSNNQSRAVGGQDSPKAQLLARVRRCDPLLQHQFLPLPPENIYGPRITFLVGWTRIVGAGGPDKHARFV